MNKDGRTGEHRGASRIRWGSEGANLKNRAVDGVGDDVLKEGFDLQNAWIPHWR